MNIYADGLSFGYQYLLDGNIWRKDVNSVNTDYRYDTTTGGSYYDSDIMTKAGNDDLVWDENGRLISKPSHKGGKNIPNYLRTFKWVPGNGLASYNSYSTAFVLEESLHTPSGAMSFLNWLFGHYIF